VRLEGSKASLQCSQQRYRHLGVVTFLKCICNNFALAGDVHSAMSRSVCITSFSTTVFRKASRLEQ
jgi:hypothetical protein